MHRGFQDRLFLATFGLFLLPGRLYGNTKYVNRLEYLWQHVRRNEVELPEFVYDFDKELEDCPAIDYGMETGHLRLRNVGPRLHHNYYCYEDSSMIPGYSMRCIAQHI